MVIEQERLRLRRRRGGGGGGGGSDGCRGGLDCARREEAGAVRGRHEAAGVGEVEEGGGGRGAAQEDRGHVVGARRLLRAVVGAQPDLVARVRDADLRDPPPEAALAHALEPRRAHRRRSRRGRARRAASSGRGRGRESYGEWGWAEGSFDHSFQECCGAGAHVPPGVYVCGWVWVLLGVLRCELAS